MRQALLRPESLFFVKKASRDVALAFTLILLSSAAARASETEVDCDDFGPFFRSEPGPKGYETALRFQREYDAGFLPLKSSEVKASFAYETNLTAANKKTMIDAGMRTTAFRKKMRKKAVRFPWKTFMHKDRKLYRWFKLLSDEGKPYPEKKQKQLSSLVADMGTVYSTAKVCKMEKKSDCTLPLEPDLVRKMAQSRNYDELAYYWTEWREVSGKKVKEKYLQYSDLLSEGARLNGLRDASEVWLSEFESDTIEQDLEQLWLQVRPFYKMLHAYVRSRLRGRYPDKGIREDGPIPAHLLGNMWSQDWSNIMDLVQPYPRRSLPNITKTLLKKGMKPIDLFKMSEEFQQSLGFHPMTKEFWKHTVMEKPKDREIVCHASAWDLYDGKDFRIKMCTKVNDHNLRTVHHEMGHIQYYQQYANQPGIFRDGPNPGFHEAIGDTIDLSVSTIDHMKKISLVSKNVKPDFKMNINWLMEMALTKIPTLPYGYILDIFRWKVFKGQLQPKSLNRGWWELRQLYQGVCPPSKRKEEDFDPGSKYHVVSGSSYIRYFASIIVQFQFHKALCREAGFKGPLHNCDIYKHKKAGKLFSDMMKLGNSVHWTEAMDLITRNQTSKMDAQALLEYFGPLIKWLRKKTSKMHHGWKTMNPMTCP